jgi:hypothetical protein
LQWLKAPDKTKLDLAAAEKTNKAVSDLLRKSYRHTISEVAKAMSDSMPAAVIETKDEYVERVGSGITEFAASSGSKRIQYSHLPDEQGNMSAGRLATDNWRKLSYLYGKGGPKHWTKKNTGTPFWKNQGGMSAGFRALVSANPGVRKGKTEIVKTRESGKFILTTHWTFEPVGDKVADNLIRLPFVAGSEDAAPRSATGLGVSVGQGLWKLGINEVGRVSGQYPYEGRPWVARMAATLGRDLRSRVWKLGKK